jgi:CHASE2 domain-containing sensor protein
MEYKNFDLCIEGRLGDRYPVRAQSETMGDTDGVLVLEPDCLKTAESLKDVEGVGADGSQLMDFGASLHQCLFRDGVGDLLRESLGGVRQDDEKGVRIRLMISPPEIAALPWEVLYDERSKCFLSTSGKTPLTRYIRLFEPIKSLKIHPPVRVLVLIPEGSGLDVDKEKAILRKALGELETVSITILEGRVTRAGISAALVEERYHILHFIGHGVFESEQGSLVINSEDGGEDLISADAFADFFRDYASLKLIVLNSCQGAEVASTRPLAGMAPQLVLRGIPAVIAMQYPISDAAALLFAREFYLKLCKGWSRGQVDAAVSHARNRIHMNIGEPLAFATPVLFMRSFTGVIFDLETEQKAAPDAGTAVNPSAWGAFKRSLLGLFNAQPVKHINRLKEVKKTYQLNIEAIQELTKDAPPEAAEEAARAISQEREEMSTVDRRIARWERTFAASLLASVLIFALGYVGLFNFPFHLDDWLESHFVPYMDDYVAKKFSPHVRLILADEKENGELGVPGPDWRQYHAGLINALSNARAKVVVFDLYMSDPTEHDGLLAGAVERAAARGTRVIVGKALDEEGNVSKDIAETLKASFGDGWGNIDVGGQRGGFVRVYQLAQPARDAAPADPQSAEISVTPSLGLKAVTLFLSTGAPLKALFNEDAEQVQMRGDGALVKSIPVARKDLSLFDFPYDLVERSRLDDATRAYREVYERRGDGAFLKDYENKIVIVGYKTRGESFNVLQGEQRYGSEIHANVVSNILGNVYVRLLPSSYDFLIVLLMAGVGALVQARFRHVFSTRLALPLPGQKKSFDVPGLLFLADIIYLLVAFQIYKHELTFIVKSYHLAAPFITYWLTGRARKRSSLKSS